MFIAFVPLLVAVIGLLMYVLSTNAKVAEIGRILMACGFLITLFCAAKTIRVF